MKLLKAAERGDIAALELHLKNGDDIAYVQKHRPQCADHGT